MPLRRIREALVSAITEDLGLKLISLLVAMAAWVWVQTELVIDGRTQAEVRYVLPDGLLSANVPPRRVALTVEGPQAAVRRLERQKPSILVDLSESREGSTVVDFTTLPLPWLPEGVKVLHLSPPSVEITLERRMVRRLAVQPTTAGEPAPGHQVTGISAEPSHVELTGPRSVVRALEHVGTDPVDLAGLAETRTFEAPLNLAAGLSAEPQGPVAVRVEVAPIISERHFLDVPVEVSRPGVTVAEKVRVVLRGPVTALEKIEAEDVRIRLHLPEGPPPKTMRIRRYGAEPGEAEVLHGGASSIEPAQVDPAEVTLVTEAR